MAEFDINNNKEIEVFLRKLMINNEIVNIVGQIFVDEIRSAFENSIEPGYSEYTEGISYNVDNYKKGLNDFYEIKILSESIVPIYIEKGVRPHIIMPKNKRALKFQSKQVSSYKNGKKINFKDNVVVKKVKHPGFEGREYLAPALFLAKKKLENMYK